MARRKLPENEKKKEFSITMNEKLNELLEKYMKENGVSNKSKYIEKLVKEDLENRGENIETDF